jgi:integrase
MASIRQRPSGQWRARYRDEAGKEHARHFPRKVDARAWLDEVTASVVTGQYVSPGAGRITFAAFYGQWAARQVWVPGTRRAMDLAAGSATFADLPMRVIRRSHVEGWVKGMSDRGLAAGTIHTRANNVRAVLRAAVADRVIPADPSEGVTLPRRRKSAAAMTIPTTAEVGALVEVADGPFKAFLGLCAFAGLRLGEAAGVQVDDIDFLRRTLTVSRQIQRENGGFEIRAPKYGSERTIYLAPTLVEMLSEHVGQYVPAAQGDRWLFTGDGRNPPHQNTIGHRWRSTLARAGIDGLKLHDCRHFYASGLIAQGCDVVTVQRALGHANATTTLGTYSHLWPTAEDRTRKAAEAMLTEALSPTGNLADSVRTSRGSKVADLH